MDKEELTEYLDEKFDVVRDNMFVGIIANIVLEFFIFIMLIFAIYGN